MEFTVKTAEEYAQEKKLEVWIQNYLLDHGNNKRMALRMQNKGKLLGPINFSLNKLVKIAGPERNMKYKKPEDEWNRRVDFLVDNIKQKHEYPPIIVWYNNQKLEIADGNHRYDAFKKLDVKEYPIIIWFKLEKDYYEFLK